MEKQNFQSKYETIQKIGEGAHSSVYKCKNLLTDELFAVKISSNIDEEMKNKLINQYKLLKVLNHENIIKVFQLIYNEELQKLYVVSQLCDYPNLKEEILSKLKNSQICFVEKQALELIQKILNTLQYIQDSGVCHRGIKPENILYNSETKDFKIIDFDISKERFNKNEEFLMWTNTGSLHYRAPQTFLFGYGQKVDIWAVGIILYELFSGSVPFISKYEAQTIKKIKSSKINFQNIKCSAKSKALLTKMLQKQDKKRFSCEECLTFLSNEAKKYQKDDSLMKLQKKCELFDLQLVQQKKYFQESDMDKMFLIYTMKMEYLKWEITEF